MELLFGIYAALAAALVLALAVLMLRGVLAERRRHGWASTLSDKYLRVVICSMVSGEERLPRFPMLDRAGARLQLAEVIAGLVTATYGLDQAPLRRIVEKYGIGDYLLRRAACSHGYRRAHFLGLLSRLPVDKWTVEQVARYASDRNRYVRFNVLLMQMGHDPSIALQLISAYPDQFSAHEVSEVMVLLRRGMLPIAYEPLVLSPSRNMQTIGLGIVKLFSIEDAENLLLRMVGTAAPETSRQALYTLCALKRPLSGAGVARRIEAMSRGERKSLMRYMALEGYSPQSLRRLFDELDRPYYESLVQSYKRCLA